MNLLDKVEDLAKLNREELDEILLDPKYNKANLRQIIREALKMSNEWKGAYEYQKEQYEKYKTKVSNLQKGIRELDEQEEQYPWL